MAHAAKCAVCDAPAPPPFRPQPPEQAPDLDGRPGEPARSTLRRWVLQCRNCGACGADLSLLPAGSAAVVRTADYQALPSAFLCAAALCRAAGDGPDAAEATLHAAWQADDAGRDARALRLQAVADWGEPGNAEMTLRMIDVLRRAEAFEMAEVRANALAAHSLDDTNARLLAFQRARIAARDAGRHLISSALRPPARTPHVTHGKTAKNGFWSRLMGR